MRLTLAFLLVATLSGQDPPPPPAGGGQRRPPPEPKNLKVLKIPPSELIPTMRFFSSSLGVECNHCHVQGNFASDEKPTKETARVMITMAQDINTKLGTDGKMRVTCYTCHRGETLPKTSAAASAEPPH